MISVDCIFNLDGTVTVYRITEEGRWIPVEQGRQWVDGEGRHVLIIYGGQPAREILLRSDTLTWELGPPPSQRKILV